MSSPKEFCLQASFKEHGFLDTILPWSVSQQGLHVIEYSAYEQVNECLSLALEALKVVNDASLHDMACANAEPYTECFCYVSKVDHTITEIESKRKGGKNEDRD